MNEIEKELELSNYLKEWVDSHYAEWNSFYHDVNRNRRNGIYRLEGGTILLNLLNDIMGNVEDKFSLPNNDSHLIPTQFASIQHLLRFLERFKKHVDSFKPLIEKNIQEEVVTNYIISGICGMINSIDETVDRCVRLYRVDNMPRPYQILREQLFEKNIDGFFQSIEGVLKGVPYISRKEHFNEGHFQTMLQILLTILGFEPVPEAVLSDGRIDMVLKLEALTYIFEFKYTEGNRSQARRALKQIKDKGYHKPYNIHSEEIIGVGVSFSKVTKNVNGFASECLYKNDRIIQ